MTEEQAHVEWLKQKAQSLNLTFDQYMLFLIFEDLEHSPYINTETLTRPAWETQEEMPQNPEAQEEGSI